VIYVARGGAESGQPPRVPVIAPNHIQFTFQ
jgi:hypothetical protein